MVGTLVFIHGWATTPEVWAGQKEYFSGEYEVILADISAAKNIKEAADSVYGLVRDKNNFILIGWSLGWLVILELLKTFKIKPNGIISVNSTAKFVDDGYLGAGPKKAHLDKTIRDCRRDAGRAFSDFYKTILSDKGNEAFTGLNPDGIDYNNLIHGLNMLKDCDYREFIKDVRIPALFIAGEQDTICPQEASFYMQEKIQGSKLKIMECGHMPFWSNAVEFNSMVHNFLKGL